MAPRDGGPAAPHFRFVGLDADIFSPLFELSDDALAARHARRCVATESPGFPCRVSLEDAQVGDELLLLPFDHQPAASPYRASGPIFVRRGARRRTLAVGEVPDVVLRRLISVRAYDAAATMVAATVCEGRDVAVEIARHFADDAVDYLHLHNAKQGCFACTAVRAEMPTG